MGRLRLSPLVLIYALLSVGGGLAWLRLVLRLLAADELSPLGNLLAQLGGLVSAPFNILSKTVIGQTPGSTFEVAALLAGAGYLLSAGLLALIAAVVRSYKRAV